MIRTATAVNVPNDAQPLVSGKTATIDLPAAQPVLLTIEAVK